MTRRRAFILAGGEGRRLAPLTTVIPKPLVPVGDRSILEVILGQLGRHGITNVTISLGHLGHLIQAVIGDGKRFGVEVDYTEEESPLGTAGALSLIRDLRDTDHVIVLNGDTLTDLNFASLFDVHFAADADATIAIHRQSVVSAFGVITVGPDNGLERYDEKPVLGFLASMGVNVLSARAIATMVPPRRVDMPDFLIRLRDNGLVVRCTEVTCTWLDLGRIDDVQRANELVQADPLRFARG
jgi:NDP-sugar pyrophosphorylase family protein